MSENDNVIKMSELNVEDDSESKVKIVDFISKFNGMTSEKAKEAYIKRIVKSDDYYVPYTIKVVYAQQIIETANFREDGIYILNSPKEYQLYISSLLMMYTNLDVIGQQFNLYFDALEKYQILDKIIKQMPIDKNEFDIVFHMIKDDAEKNYGEIRFNTSEIAGMVKKGILEGTEFILTELLKILENGSLNEIIQSISSNSSNDLNLNDLEDNK